MLDFAQIWRAADKVVFSRSLEAVSTPRTRIERDFDPAAVRQVKEHSDRDITVGGPVLAAEALKAGLVDECHLIVCPVVVGGGKKCLPSGLRLRLECWRSGVSPTVRCTSATPPDPDHGP